MGRREEISSMGSLDDYVKINEAARILGKSSRTIKNYTRSGTLRYRKFRGQGKSHWIRKDEVEALKEILEENGGGICELRELLRSIKVRLHAMDRRLDFLMYVNGLDVSVLRDAPDEDLISLYDEVCAYLKMPRTEGRKKIPHMQRWAQVLMQVTEVEMERLVGPTQNVTPWVPFYKLCRMLMKETKARKGFAFIETLQFTYRMLDKARQQLGQSIVVFTESQASEIGPRKTKGLYRLGVSEDSLTRYIQSDIGHDMTS